MALALALPGCIWKGQKRGAAVAEWQRQCCNAGGGTAQTPTDLVKAVGKADSSHHSTLAGISHLCRLYCSTTFIIAR